MLLIFIILIVITSVALGLIVLIQNPKGGGLSGSIAGFSNQFMGVKQTTDVLEKGTWVFAAIVGLLCLLSPVFIPKAGADNSIMNNAPTVNPTPKVNTPTPAPTNQGTLPTTPTPTPSPAKP